MFQIAKALCLAYATFLLIGPAFANPSQDAFITQTVYGFLDFTTTIGNTVMIFSPQSAAPEEAKPPQPVVNVIDSKPAAQNKENPIKPSKTVKKEEKKSETKEVITVVNTQKAEVIKSSVKPVIASKVSVVNVAPVIASKVQVVSEVKPKIEIVSKVEVVSSSKPPPIIASKVEIVEEKPSIINKVVEVQIDEEPAVVIGNNIGDPEYDFLSRQPSEVVEETYKVVNLKPSSKFRLKPRPTAEPKSKPTKRADSLHPTGLVTKLGGTVVKDGVTTVHETSVIGTYISGKYAQVLQSTSQVINGGKHPKGKINPSPTLRILKTAAPALGKGHKHNRHLEPTPSGSINEESAALPAENSIKGARKPGGGSVSFKRFKNKQREQEIEENEAQDQGGKRAKTRTTQSPRKQHTTKRNQKYGGSRTTSSPVSVYSEPATSSPSNKRYGGGSSNRRNKQQKSSSSQSSQEPSSGGSFSRRGYKPKVQAAPVETNDATTSLYKFKLNRSPGRWQYKTTAKPRVTIRKQNDDESDEEIPQQDTTSNDVVTPQARSDESEGLVGSESIATLVDDEETTDNKLDTPHPLETIKVEISTPPDFKDIYYEIATIKSPYTFQVGSVKNTRYITVTSTFEKSLDHPESTISPTITEPLTENILATSSNYVKDNNYLDSSIATLPHLYLASDMETPPLETLTETFSTTQTMLKTHILPVIKGVNDTTSYTLVQTYHISRLVTATKTLPPMEAYQFIPSRTLNEFNSHLDEAGSELHLELEFGDENDEDGGGHAKRVFPADLDLASIGSDISDLSEADKSRLLESKRTRKEYQVTTPKPVVLPEAPPTPGLSPEQLQQLAFLRLLNPAAAAGPLPGQGQVITTSKPVLKVETVYESHVIPLVNGGNTVFTTISKSLGMVTKTEYEYGTSTLPGLPIPPVNPLFPVQQQAAQFAVTTSPVVQSTVVTETQSKILKLTFGAKTAYTTIFSTKLVPTLLTTYMTASVPVQPTAAFPGYFPAPYPPFPYVG